MSTFADKPGKPLNELLTTALVHIYVGTENTHWILHERLLTYHSPFFHRLFYSKDFESSKTKNYGLPDVDDEPFRLFVGWLYSTEIKPPTIEKEIGPLLDLYLLSQRLESDALASDVVDVVRNFYHSQETYPGLRRVQYVYANTEEDNEMREMMVGSVARYLTLADAIPPHWENALKKNGQLSVDIIRSIQQWHLESRSVPDVRDLSQERGREHAGFSKVEDDETKTNGTSIKQEDRESVHAGVNGN